MSGDKQNKRALWYQSASYDKAASIARYTPVVVDANSKAVTAAQLTALDTNKDGQLSLTESAGLRFWRDLDEQGQAGTGEVTAVDRVITAAEYGLYTQANGLIGAGAAAAPVQTRQAPQPARPTAPSVGRPGRPGGAPGVPASNYRNLRDTDNAFPWVFNGRYGVINWASNQIKINYNNQSYLIGTDGNDAFDANYYAGQPYFNVNLLTNFLAGGGNDTMGGSARADRLWGGDGNDALLGYAGDDQLFGEAAQRFLNDICCQKSSDLMRRHRPIFAAPGSAFRTRQPSHEQLAYFRPASSELSFNLIPSQACIQRATAESNLLSFGVGRSQNSPDSSLLFVPII